MLVFPESDDICPGTDSMRVPCNASLGEVVKSFCEEFSTSRFRCAMMGITTYFLVIYAG